MSLAVLVPLLPLAAALLALAFKSRLGRQAGYLTTAAGLGSLLLSAGFVVWTGGGNRGEVSLGWLPAAGDALVVGFVMDPLAAYMTTVVSGVGLLVTVYALGYMREDPAAGRFFAFFGFFIAAMLGLVLAADFLTLLVFWELVGLSSYALIGFHWREPDAPPAATKAFLMTRTLDAGLYLAAFLVFGATGSLGIQTANDLAGGEFTGAALTATAVLLLAAAIGKSAQVPSVTWLPDAMAGPTPVSALIHSATMVAAGVYLVARTFPLFQAADVLLLVGIVGGATAIGSGLAALWQTDLKRLLAASTSSQLGFMLLALGAGSPFAALFHLAVHAVFKSLLFLGAGNVQESLGTTDMRKMGGLRRRMPNTFRTFAVGALALAAVPPLAGFFSKEAVLGATFESGKLLYFMGLAGALITAVYAAKAILLPFFGQETGSVEERGVLMLAPAWVLALLTVPLGFFSSTFARFLELEHVPLKLEALISVAAVLTGLLAGWGLWRLGELMAPRSYGLGILARPAETFFWLDALITWLVVRPALAIAGGLSAFDGRVVDAVVEGIGRIVLWLSEALFTFNSRVVDAAVEIVGRAVLGLSGAIRTFDVRGVDAVVEWAGRAGMLLARLQGIFDERGIDGVVREIGLLFVAGGGLLRRIQTGLIHQYLILGLVSLIGLIVILGIASL